MNSMATYEDLLRLHGRKELCNHAAKIGDLGILQWARQNGCPWNEMVCAWAASSGHLNILQWARQNSCPWDDITCATAAGSGNLHIVQWARQNGCPWDAWTCSFAAKKGHLHIVQWARQNGCPWDEMVCLWAGINDHLHVLTWALKMNCDMSDDWKQGFEKRSSFPLKHYQSLKWLYEHYGFYGKSSVKEWLDNIHEALNVVMIVPDLVELIKSNI